LKSNRRSRASSRSSASSGGSPSVSDVERRLRVRSMLPIDLEYEPFESTQSMKRLLRDLTVWVLARRIHHRAASAVKGLLRTWIDVDLHEKLPELEKRIEELEKARGVKA